MAARQVEVINLPAEVVVKSGGLSMDIGGSVFKLVYRTKSDYEDAKAKTDKEMSQVHLVSFSRAELEQGVQYIKDEAYLTQDDGASLSKVFACGVGSSQYKPKFERAANLDVGMLLEMDSFMKAMQYLLRTTTRDQLFYPLLVEATREPIKLFQGLMAMYAEAMKNTSVKFDVDLDAVNALEVKDKHRDKICDRPVAETEDVYPYMIAMCGSGFAFMTVEKDGTLQLVDGSNRGGRCFYGLGTLLTGCKTFEELIDLAAQGKSGNIDVGTTDLAKEYETEGKDDNDIYSTTMKGEEQNNLLYCFGKAVGSSLSDFSKADLAATLLNMVCLDLAQSVLYCAKDQGCKHIFFAGSFPSSEIVRSIITTECTRKNILMSTMKGLGEGIKFDFVKSGGHLGAIGCFLHSMNQASAVSSAETKQEDPEDHSTDL